MTKLYQTRQCALLLITLACSWLGQPTTCSAFLPTTVGSAHRWPTPIPIYTPSVSLFSVDGDITYRDCEYSELGMVADIIIDSFYTSQTSWRKLNRLAELNRLQQNFPYTDTDLHQMLVAVIDNQKVVGFCDVDARPCKTHPPLPRPYLSDLAVQPEYRRRGIAKSLVQRGEYFLQNVPHQELFIRVEETNQAAITMYTGLGYETVGIDKEKDKIIFRLWKKLDTDDNDKSKEATSIQEFSADADDVKKHK